MIHFSKWSPATSGTTLKHSHPGITSQLSPSRPMEKCRGRSTSRVEHSAGGMAQVSARVYEDESIAHVAWSMFQAVICIKLKSPKSTDNGYIETGHNPFVLKHRGLFDRPRRAENHVSCNMAVREIKIIEPSLSPAPRAAITAGRSLNGPALLSCCLIVMVSTCRRELHVGPWPESAQVAHWEFERNPHFSTHNDEAGVPP